MANRNRESKIEFAFSHVFWCIISMMWYAPIVFRAIYPLSIKQSKIILWCLVIVSLILGYLVTQRRHRNGANLVISVLIPYELYTLMTYGKYCSILIRISWGVALVLCCAFCVWILSRPKSDSSKKQTILKSRIRRCFIGCRALCAICLSSILFFGVATQVNGGIPVTMSTTPSTGQTLLEQDTIKNNVDILDQLRPDQWEKLSLSEKASVLQVVANIERTYLGLPHELRVKTDILDDDTLGSYNRISHQITVDAAYLEDGSPEEILGTIAHECYHAYQHMLVDLYIDSDERYKELQIFYDVRKYAEEFSSYEDGGIDNENFHEYYIQSVEIDARNYAADAVDDYYAKLEEYSRS